MSTLDRRPSTARPIAPGSRLGDRLRQLRVAAGLTQTDVAGTRFSKEYISQIERGKTRPTREAVEWLAQRLGVNADFLQSGVSTDERTRIETRLARAEALSEAAEQLESIEHVEDIRTAVLASGSPELELRMLAVEAWARQSVGQVREAIDLLVRARSIAEAPQFSDVERADVLFRLGVCRYKLSSIATSVALLDEALQLADRSGLPCDLLRSRILDWRSRCRRRQRDYEAAREDVERALELAEGLDDPRMVADVFFQASLIAEREGQWVSARRYAERAKTLYEEVDDRLDVGRMLNNLGAFNFLLGKPDDALTYLQDAVKVLIDVGGRSDEVANADFVAWRTSSSTRAIFMPPRSRPVRRSRSSKTTRTGSAKSATRISCSAARCSSRAGSRSRRPRSHRPRRPSTSSSQRAIAPPCGSPRAISQRVATTTPRQRVCIVARQKPCKTSGSNERRCTHDKVTLDLHRGAR